MTGRFNDPRISPIDNKYYELKEDLRYTWSINGVINTITIKAGFVFDGASIPAWATMLMWLLPFLHEIHPFGSHVRAAVVHDYIWMYKGRMPVGFHMAHINGEWVDAAYNADGMPVWTFKTSNKLFARHLRELGVSKADRRAMYLAVASPIGWFNWLRGKVPSDARPKKLIAKPKKKAK